MTKKDSSIGKWFVLQTLIFMALFIAAVYYMSGKTINVQPTPVPPVQTQPTQQQPAQTLQQPLTSTPGPTASSNTQSANNGGGSEQTNPHTIIHPAPNTIIIPPQKNVTVPPTTSPPTTTQAPLNSIVNGLLCNNTINIICIS